MSHVAAYVMCPGADLEEGVRLAARNTRPGYFGPILAMENTGLLLLGVRLALAQGTQIIRLEPTTAPKSPQTVSEREAWAWGAEHSAWIIRTALEACTTYLIETLYYGPFEAENLHDPRLAPGFEALARMHTDTAPVSLRRLEATSHRPPVTDPNNEGRR